jgi:hypothetical protein
MINDLGYFRESLLDGRRNLGILVVDNAGNLQRRLGVKTLGCFVLTLGSKVLE